MLFQALTFVALMASVFAQDTICRDGDCYPRIFIPTEHFQAVRDGQEIPAGTPSPHNFNQTGEKEAKLNNPADDDSNSESIVLNDLQIIDTPKRAMESYNMPPRRDDSAELTDSQAFEHAYQVLLVTEKYTSATPIDIEIGNLESFAHDREYGIKLVQAESLKRLLMISRTSVESQTRQGAARVIGSALWNNPEALEIVRGSNLVKRLIDIVKEENDASVCASLVFALSAAVAGEDGIREFLNAGGSPVLQELFAKGEVEVQGKCATFVEDNLPANRALIGDDELTQWCELFQLALLQNPQDITGEKVLSSLIAIKREARKICTTKPAFIEWLANNLVAKNHSETMHELLKESRHMFGNPKAARKTGWEDEPRQKDEL